MRVDVGVGPRAKVGARCEESEGKACLRRNEEADGLRHHQRELARCGRVVAWPSDQRG